MSVILSTQNDLLLNTLLIYYDKEQNMSRMVDIINGDANISLRIIDWFVTNYAKKNFTIYKLSSNKRFKVYSDYKLKLKSYSKRRFDPFCRWDRITVPYKNGTDVQTTLGQLNFFKWAFENEIIEYIEKNYQQIELDMNSRNSTAKKKMDIDDTNKTRKRREELSVSATKTVKRDIIDITVEFE